MGVKSHTPIPPYSHTNMTPTTLSFYAMATRFELMLYGDDPTRLRAIGEEALGEIERLDTQLSLYRPDSELSWINAHAAAEAVKVEPRLFKLLQRCIALTEQTNGAFDITVAPLMQAWGFMGGTGKIPSQSEQEAAKAVVGIEHVHLDEEQFTIRFDRREVRLDLGAVGKGYAAERAVDILRENGITSALLHGGTSTICAIGTPPDQTAWRVAIRNPVDADKHLEVIDLRDSSLSVSAVHGKSFTNGSQVFGHVIDPRTGQATKGALTAAVVGPCPTECDALSTALLVLGKPGLALISERFPGYRGIVAV